MRSPLMSDASASNAMYTSGYEGCFAVSNLRTCTDWPVHRQQISSAASRSSDRTPACDDVEERTSHHRVGDGRIESSSSSRTLTAMARSVAASGAGSQSPVPAYSAASRSFVASEWLCERYHARTLAT